MNFNFLTAATLAVIGLTANPCYAQTEDTEQASATAGGSQYYLTAGPNASFSGYHIGAHIGHEALYSSKSDRGYEYVWSFIKVNPDEEDITTAEDRESVYRIYNKLTKKYIGRTSTSAQSVILNSVTEIGDAGRYCVMKRTYTDNNEYYSLVDIDNDNAERSALNITDALKNYALYNGTALRPNSLFSLTDPSEEEVMFAASLAERYADNYTGFHEYDYVGDLIPTATSEAAYQAVVDNVSKGEASYDDYAALYDIMTEDSKEPMTSARRVQIIPGHYYHIESPYGGYNQGYIGETYYYKDYNPNMKRQRVHFYDKAGDHLSAHYIPVPSFWKFELQDKKNGTDADAYYKIVAANSGLGMRKVGYNTIVDTRPLDDNEIGIYSYQKEDELIQYSHSVTLLSHDNDEARTKTYHLATFEDMENYNDFDLRQGDAVCPPSDKIISGANNWRIHELTKFNLWFPEVTTTKTLDQEGNVVSETYDGSCYRSLYLPFAVKVPDGAVAYTALDRYSLYGNEAFELARIALPDNTTNVIPAYTPAIVVARDDQTLTFEILYDNTSSPILFSLVGTTTPLEVADGEVIYVTDDRNDDDGHTKNFVRKIGGTDYSYDKTDIYKNGQPSYSLANSSATYILDVNHAYLKAASKDEPAIKAAEIGGRRSTGVDDTTVRRRAHSEEYRYYDLSGRPVEKPVRGIYVRSDGVKILIP